MEIRKISEDKYGRSKKNPERDFFIVFEKITKKCYYIKCIYNNNYISFVGVINEKIQCN